MKQKQKPAQAAAQEPQRVPIRFEFTDPEAVSVCLAGSFNGWHPTAKALHRVGNDRWETETDLAPGLYEYCFVVDGEWTADPLAENHVTNPFGGFNSLLQVGCSLDAAHLADAATAPLQSADNQK